MGSSNSKVLGYRELRNSIPGLLVEEKDFPLFYSLCKIETSRTISNVLYPSSTQLFYVVLSGEVYAQLSVTGSKPVQATTFTVAETIHFFNAKLRTNSANFEFNDAGDCLRNGEVKLSLHFKSYAASPARVIGMDRRGYDEFKLKSRSNIYAITSFVNMNMIEFFQTSTSFQTMTAKQANIFGLLLKLRLQHTGMEIGTHLPPAPLTQLKHRRRRRILPNKIVAAPVLDEQTEGHFIMLLHGGGLAIPVHSDVEALGRELRRKEAASAGQEDSLDRSTSSFNFHLHAATAMSDAPKVFRQPSDEEKFVSSRSRRRSLSSESNSSSTAVMAEQAHVAIPPGIVIGSDYFFVRDTSFRIRSYMTTVPSLLGYLPTTAMDALCQVDARFKRVYSRNILLRMIQWVRVQVPLLTEMDDWSIALLSCKITVVGKKKDEVIVRAGDPGNCAYIILTGAVKEISEIIPDQTETSASIRIPGSGGASSGSRGSKAEARELSGRRRRNSNASTVVVQEHVRRWGHMIGVMALTTSQPYFNTAIATEPTLLMCLSKPILDQIYYNDKAKLCEVSIRLMGAEVDLLHAIDHPTGSALFLQYLTKQLAAENLTFYKAVDRYDSLCNTVVKQIAQIKQLQVRLQRGPSLGPVGSSVECQEDSACSRDINPHQLTTPVQARMDMIYSVGGLSPSVNNNNATSPMKTPAGYRVTSKPRPIVRALRNRLSSFSRRVKVALAEVTTTTQLASTQDCSDDASPPLLPAQKGRGVGHRNQLQTYEPAPPPAVSRSHSSSSIASSSASSSSSAEEQEGVEEGCDVVSSTETTQHKVSDEMTLTALSGGGGSGSGDVPERSIKSLYPPQAQTPLVDAAPDDGVQIPTCRTKRMHRRDFLLAKYDRILAAYDYHDHRTHSPNPGTSIHSGSTEDYSQQIGVKVVGSGSTEIEEHMLTHTEILEVGEARAKRLSRKVKKKLHSLHKHIADLQRVARAIMETYLYNGADHQVNLPDTMRADCVQRFTAWCDSMEHTHDGSHSTCLPDNSTTSVCIQENEELQIPDTARNRGDPEHSDIHEPRRATTPPHSDCTVYSTVLTVDNIDLSFVNLFKEAKGEVLKLLRDGMFPRWKNTPDFRSFIEGIKPYNAVMEESMHDEL